MKKFKDKYYNGDELTTGVTAIRDIYVRITTDKEEESETINTVILNEENAERLAHELMQMVRMIKEGK